MNQAPEASIVRSQRTREQLAKAWLMQILERTPLGEIEEVPVDWIAREGPPLIADIMRGVADPLAAGELPLPQEGLERIGELGRLRTGEAATAQLPRDLAALQALLIEAMRRSISDRHLGAFAAAVERLAEIFGGIQATALQELVRERTGDAGADPLTGLPGTVQLQEWLRILLAEYRRYRHPFALLLIAVEGLDRINEAHGPGSGDRMLAAAAGIVPRQIRTVDRAFRVSADELAVLGPHQRAVEMRALAERLCRIVERSQRDDGPRIFLAAGLASCPDHAEDAEALLAAAEEAAWAAKAGGLAVAVRGSEPLAERA